jgi:hypothetical protein
LVASSIETRLAIQPSLRLRGASTRDLIEFGRRIRARNSHSGRLEIFITALADTVKEPFTKEHGAGPEA